MNEPSIRTIQSIPEEVEHAMLLFLHIGRELMMKKLVHQLPFKGFPNCHVIARAYARTLRHVEVCDGGALFLRGNTAIAWHSWLRFKEHPEFGVDVAPLGAIPFFTFPNLLFFDAHVLFQEVPLPPRCLLNIEQEVVQFEQVLRQIICSFSKKQNEHSSMCS